MENSIVEIGVGGIFAILVLRQTFDFIQGFRNKKNGNGNFGSVEVKQLDDLHKWHQPDDTGVQEWKNPRLADVITKLSDNIDDSTKVLQSIYNKLEANTQKIEDIQQKVSS